MPVLVKRLALVCCAVFANACGSNQISLDAGSDAGRAGCFEARDCGDPNLFACNSNTGECEPGCNTNDNCNNRGSNALSFCPTGQDKCLCDDFRCVAKRCSADVDCGTQVCRDGACVAPPPASTVTACTITPDVIVLRQGASAQLFVSAWSAGNAPLVVKEGATWAAPAGSPLTVMMPATGNRVTVSAASTSSGMAPVAAVTATFGATTCTAKAIVLPAPAPQALGVIFTDELTGRPINGAKVVLSSNAGMSVAEGTTDGRGYAEVSVAAPAAAPYTVTAFHPDFAYVTVARYSPSAGADARMVHLASRRNQLDKYGGYKGTFTNVPQTGNIHAAFTGSSIPGAITSISLGQLLGSTVPTDIRVAGQNLEKVPLPSGTFLGFGATQIRNTYASTGLAGVCADESKVAAGTCGTRTGWALAGDIKLSDLPIDALMNTANLNIPLLLSRLTTVFKSFNSSIVRDVDFELRAPQQVDAGMGTTARDLTNVSFFKEANHNFTQMPLSFSYPVKMPTLPQFGGEFADGALVLGGANVPGRGVVPLGLGVGVDSATPRNGVIDAQAPLAAGRIPMRMAPTHAGLEGADYVMLTAALSIKSIQDVGSGTGASVLLTRVPDNKLQFDPTGAQGFSIDLSSFTFAPFIDGTRVNYSSAPQGGLNPRSFRFATNPAQVSIVKVVFSDDLDRRWDVWLDAADGASGFTLPAPPSGGMYADRLFADGMANGKRSSYAVQTMSLDKQGGVLMRSAPIAFTALVEDNGTNMAELTNYLVSFSFVDKGSPSVTIAKPEGGASSAMRAALARGGKLELSVAAFNIGTGGAEDGVVRLLFEGPTATMCGGAGTNAATVSMELTAGNGKLEYPLPMGCTGAVSVTASLVGTDGMTALSPPVATTKLLTVN